MHKQMLASTLDLSKRLLGRRLVAAATLATCFVASQATAQEVTLRAISPWPKSFVVTQSLLEYIDKVNAAGKGVVQLQFAGGPEVIPANDQAGAIRRGSVDIYYGTISQLQGMMPETRALSASNRSVPDLRAAGAYDLLDSILQKKVNVNFIGQPDRGWGFYMLLAKEPRTRADGTLDLSGVKMRSHPLYNDLLTSLNATPVVLPTTDIYTAFERGTIDGLAWPEIGAADFNLQKFAKVRVYPTYYQSDIIAVANADRWKALSPAAKKIIIDVMRRHEDESRVKFEELVKAEQRMLEAAGNRAFTLSPSGAADLLRKADSLPWAAIEKADTTYVKELRAKFVK